MKYPTVVVFVILTVFFQLASVTAVEPDTRPNIVVIMVDDLSLDLFNSLVEGGWMPNLQSNLIDRGVSFENSFVTNSVCCPSRATFLTGQYSHNHGVLSNKSPHPLKSGIAWPGWFPVEGVAGKNESTLSTWLHDSGYYTGYIGKYLNGYGAQAPYNVPDTKTYIPPGWDNWQGLIDPSTYRMYSYFINDNGTVVSYGDAEADYQTDVLAGRAVQFINDRAQTGQPFFLTLTPLAPHVEVLDVFAGLTTNDISLAFAAGVRPAPRHAHLIDGDVSNGEMPSPNIKPSFNEPDISDKPSCPSPLPPTGITYNTDSTFVGDRPVLDETDITRLFSQYKSMAASMLAVDDMIGQLSLAMLETGIYDNTVIVFTSDNGWFYGEHRVSGKELAYEEAIRVPLVIHVPFVIAKSKASQIVLNNDLAPTLAEIASTVPQHETDGTSIIPILLNPDMTDWHRKSFLVEHWYIPGLVKFSPATYLAVRHLSKTLDYLYVDTFAHLGDPEKQKVFREFYNHNADPFQRRSLAMPDSVTSMLDNLLLMFIHCQGANCRALESL
ncbi:MAG: sulfatase [Candidatus Scalindua rubra]|uniref:Sulfatase n=1 Tax=Candidatus Scalindua brodae TaxID=237368 RepID=A0A0B0EQA7_9BACT|nr:MAG: sulfatase [Candidatus Scalindua brodae]MBZ0109953.1 sulfatase [Candidatus Scalindua rubra]TWU35472.1 Arylsulfatase [Candidatus Brocadiaceae bacterium S225]